MGADIQCVKRLRHDFSDVTTEEILLDWESHTHRLRDFIRKDEYTFERTEDNCILLNGTMADNLVEFLKEQLYFAGCEDFEIDSELSSLINAVEENKILASIPDCPVRTEILITFL